MHALHRFVAVAAALLVAVIAGRRRDAPHRLGALRAALDGLIAGLRTMASIAWFPLVLLLFQLTETAILVRDAVRARCTEGHRCKR
jgi:NitT/TauT family transport system permease protein